MNWCGKGLQTKSNSVWKKRFPEKHCKQQFTEMMMIDFCPEKAFAKEGLAPRSQMLLGSLCGKASGEKQVCSMIVLQKEDNPLSQAGYSLSKLVILHPCSARKQAEGDSLLWPASSAQCFHLDLYCKIIHVFITCFFWLKIPFYEGRLAWQHCTHVHLLVPGAEAADWN